VEFSKARGAAAQIRWISEHRPDILITVGIEMLFDATDTTGIRYLCMQLLKQPKLFHVMTDPWRFTVPQAVRLGRRLLCVDRTLDIRLARCLPVFGGNRDGTTLDGPRAERALEILDEISVGRRVVPVLNHLTKSPDTRISSKSTLLIGKRVQNLTWARRLISEGSEPRIRASAIEAFWGLDTKAAVQLFRTSLRDPHNRVVGNSLMGLHLAGDEEVPRIVDRFAEDCKPDFRMTSAWVMGKIGDPLYTVRLGLLVKDSHPAVRSAALRSLRDLRQIEKREQLKQKEEQARSVNNLEALAELAAAEHGSGFDTPDGKDTEIPIAFWLDGSRYSSEGRSTRKPQGRAGFTW